MRSILIRYTDSKYADSYKAGNLYMSSLSSFWDFKKGCVNYEDVCSGKVTLEEFEQAKIFQEMNQQDFQEGVATQIPKEYVRSFLPKDFMDLLKFDVRFRLEAYGFCKLLCFFRVDCLDTETGMIVDEENIAAIANAKGIHINAEEIRKMPVGRVVQLVEKIRPKNVLLSSNKNHVIQLPNKKMDSFGDMAVLIKNEEEFIGRVCSAVKKQGGEVITGDVRYRQIQDRSDSDGSGRLHHVSLISSEDNGLFDMKKIIDDCPDIIWYGCLDKYIKFKDQKEWRVCWLPEERNFDAGTLHVGKLDDIIELIPREKLRNRLMEINPGYFPGFIDQARKTSSGTVSYKQFKRNIEAIDGKCRIIVDIG